jgi:microcystin-dependent protein
MASGFWTWLTGTNGGPGGNATADATINWAEGQSPSSVNNSARAMMSRLAEFRDDISGFLQTGGSSTAYSVITNQGFPTTPKDGQLIAFTPNATNDIGVTLQADGGNIFPIQSSPGKGVGAAVLIQGTPYTAIFSAALSAWLLRDFFGNPFSIPIGMYGAFDSITPPSSNFILPFGQPLSRTVYAEYFDLVGTRYGPGDGINTFNALDLRGRGIFGLDNMGGTAAGRITVAGTGVDGTAIGAVGGEQTHTLIQNELASHGHGVNQTPHGHTFTIPTNGAQFTVNSSGGAFSFLEHFNGQFSTDGANANISIIPTGGNAPHNNMPPFATLPVILRVL